MGDLATMLITGIIGLGFLSTIRRERRGPQCPACACCGREIVEEARIQFGKDPDDPRWWPTCMTRHHWRCRHCGYGWTQDR